MQTTQACKTYMMCARDKVVDLEEYRRSLAGCWQAPQPEAAEAAVLPAALPRPRRRKSRVTRWAAAMDILASLGVIAMTAAFTVWVLTI